MLRLRERRRYPAIHDVARSGSSLALPIVARRAFSAGSLLLGPIHRRLSFIPRVRSQSFVDSPFLLQLNLRQGIKQASGDGEMTSPRVALALAAAVFAASLTRAQAQDYPSRPVKVIVPF